LGIRPKGVDTGAGDGRLRLSPNWLFGCIAGAGAAAAFGTGVAGLAAAGVGGVTAFVIGGTAELLNWLFEMFRLGSEAL
jgi:hypothetical protein